jgi:phosphoglucomutase
MKMNHAGDHNQHLIPDFHLHQRLENDNNVHVALMEKLFDFNMLRSLMKRKDFSICFDGMHGVSGPYATKIFRDILGVPEENLMRCNILEDFGGCHPDPNLTYAPDLVKKMGVF